MTIDGIYNVEVVSSLGTLPGTMTLVTQGCKLTGNCCTKMGDMPIDGTISAAGDIAFSGRVKSPIGVLTLEVKANISGNDIRGQVKVGMFGTSPLTGKRV